MAESGKYPVEWRGQTYYMHDLAVKDKEEFVAWAANWNQLQNIKSLSSQPQALAMILPGIPAKCWWGDSIEDMSDLIRDTLLTPDGERKFTRILFHGTAKNLSDADLDELMKDKNKDQKEQWQKLYDAGELPPYPPANDYWLAIQNIREGSGPKA